MNITNSWISFILYGGFCGVIALIIFAMVIFEPKKVFNASTCGDNCAKWLLKITEEEDRTINLRHIMDFGEKPFSIKILNSGEIVHSMKELTEAAIDYL